MSAELAAALLKRLARVIVEVDDIIEEIEAAEWDRFDTRRTVLDMKVTSRLLVGVEEKMKQIQCEKARTKKK